MQTFTRIAVVNRGEAALRLIHAVRELNAERAQAGGCAPLQVIALYTEPERHATFVREADAGYCLGPAAARPYLDLAVLECALVQTGADAAWVGWGFVAEDAAFAELCDRLGVTFIGPRPQAMRRLGDKIGAKRLAEEIGVPVAAWSCGPVATIEEALEQARRIGYPLMLKATAGGGGRGIRAVGSDDELREAFQRTGEEAARAFGNGAVFVERLVSRGAARRGAGDRRQLRHGLGPGGARLFHPAAPPEDYRGVVVAAAVAAAGAGAERVR